MSKRRLTHQQQRRIRVQQGEVPASQLTSSDRLGPLQPGLVTAHFGVQVEVESLQPPTQGQRFLCHQRAKSDTLVTGDQVLWRPPLHPDETGVIEQRQPRRNLLARPDMRGVMKAIAANIDQMLLVIAPEPEPFANLIDRYLVAAEYYQLQTLLIVNKRDLLDSPAFAPPLKAKLEQLVDTYTGLGYPLLQTSSQQPETLLPLQQQLQGKTSILVGQSGVGKSSLLNRLLPDAGLAVGSLSEGTRKGRHTTTTSRLFHFSGGGQLIDSPGIREFTLDFMDENELAQGFVEFRPFLGQCRFRDCRHRQDPGCALQQALADGLISQLRFDSYQLIRASLQGKR